MRQRGTGNCRCAAIPVGSPHRSSRDSRENVGNLELKKATGPVLGDHLQAGIENLGQISDLLSRIEDFGARHGLPAMAVFNLQLACDEMLTNILSYGFPDARVRDIHVSISFGQDMIETEIIDNGIPFDPLAQPEPDLTLPLEERKIGGLGVHIIRTVMNHLNYHRSDGRNHLKMVLRLSDDPAKKATLHGKPNPDRR